VDAACAPALNGLHESAPGPEYPVYVTKAPPPPPDGLHVDLADGCATLSWGEVLGVTEYRLYAQSAAELDAIRPEDCWKVMERAAASSRMKRAARAREFLLYVSTKSLKEGSTEVHEQEIGHAVFGRDENYETSLDNIVRVSATDLRKRIDGYFATEGADEPLIFTIPRGSYSPVFRWREKETTPEQPGDAVAAPRPSRQVPYYREMPFILASAVALLLAIGCLFFWRQNQALSRANNRLDGKPALAALWSRFLNSPRQTDVVLADTSYGLLENITDQPYTLNDYLSYSYLAKVQSSNMSADRKADLAMIMERDHGSIGDFRAVQRIWALDPTSPKLVLNYAREYSADSIKRDNVILIGGQNSNPWQDLFSSQLGFTVEYDAALDKSYVKNSNPRPGEQTSYPVTFSPGGIVGYGFVAYLPNPSHTADALLIAGTDSQATEAAAEFVTSEDLLEKLFKKFPSKQLPYFSVLLKTARLSGTPLTEDIVAYKTY
jgi:hypothetical protein